MSGCGGALVVSELCVAQVLLIGAGLLIRSSILTLAVPVGFDTHNLLAVSVSLPWRDTPTTLASRMHFIEIEAAIGAVPGVKSVGRAQVAPIFSSGWDWTVQREGSDGHDDGAVDSDMRFVNTGYFATLGLRLVRGRAFTPADGPQGLHVAIVSRGLAKRLYGDADPIGRRISNSGGKDWLEIVGVADDMHASGLKNDVPRELYMPTTQRGQSRVHAARTRLGSGDDAFAGDPARRRSVDPCLPSPTSRPWIQALDKSLALDRFTTWLLVLLGAHGFGARDGGRLRGDRLLRHAADARARGAARTRARRRRGFAGSWSGREWCSRASAWRSARWSRSARAGCCRRCCSASLRATRSRSRR